MATKYTRTTNTTIKAAGTFDLDNMTIATDEDVLSIKTLMKDFEGADISFSVSVKTNEELEIPEADAE